MTLEMKPACEGCRAALVPDGDAWICSPECTWCPDCAGRLAYRCPNCRGELVRWPRRRREVVGQS